MAKPATDWTSLILQFIPAILGSGVLITTISGYYDGLADNPDVRLTIYPNMEKPGQAAAVLENFGGGPATNVTALITSPYNVSEYIPFSLEPFDSKKYNHRYIGIFLQKMVQGKGSVLNISLTVNETKRYAENYSAYVVYDQGSTVGEIYGTTSYFTIFVNWILTPIGIMILGIVITVTSLAIRRYALNRIRNRRKKEYDFHMGQQNEQLNVIVANYSQTITKESPSKSAIKALVALEFINQYSQKELDRISSLVPGYGEEKYKEVSKTYDQYVMKILHDEGNKQTHGRQSLDDFYVEVQKMLGVEYDTFKQERLADQVFANLTTRISLLRKTNNLPSYSGLS